MNMRVKHASLPSVFGDKARMLLYAIGIYSAYLTQGYVQEALSTTVYDRGDGTSERFPHLEALNGVQCVVCFLVAGVLLMLRKKRKTDGERFVSVASPLDFWKPGLTNSIGPACGLIALKNISYPAQVLVKSSKAIPVMIMGTIIGGKVYSALEYFSTILIAAGISLFASRGSSKVSSKLAAPNTGLGYGLCFLNLILDGFTNAAQETVHNRHPQTSSLHTMCYMNLWCGIYYGVYLFGPMGLLGLRSNLGMDCIGFCLRHHRAALHVALFCLCGAWGQLFIFETIKTFGALANTLITTTRKFFNILISVLINGNPLLAEQWAAVALVFSGLFLHSVMKRRPKSKSA